MKTQILILLCLFSLAFVSCRKNPIRIKPEGIYVPGAGGTYNAKIKGSGRIIDVPSSVKVEYKTIEANTRVCELTDEWVYAVLTLETGDLKVIVGENTTGTIRNYSIKFARGNHYDSFYIRQGAE